jgi:hypothetical protein
MDEYDVFAKRMEEQYPKIFEGRYGGFSCGPGWYPILEKLCANIQSHIDWKNEQFEKYGRGEAVPQVVAAQIKEKFGGLRFYYDGGDDTVRGMVRMAEAWADYSCEDCGAPGRQRNGGWIRTLCDTHAKAEDTAEDQE